MGAAYVTTKSNVSVASMGAMRPELVVKSIVPVVMAGVFEIYALIISVIISIEINPKAKSDYLFDGYAHLSSRLACGLAGLSTVSFTYTRRSIQTSQHWWREHVCSSATGRDQALTRTSESTSNNFLSV
ncbi:V-type proton ATPase 16 kDa proteolipid subunit-like [Canna indica]|uniref:V-type proton ATPase proteolipid subunit n=1 Tax=Canna indica TaxID=4628 RepID=A0AAQ3KQF1_9LILI|nr:V-type proton ATPase 16 kDa proteolipid subunit-like [Canna indica]